MEHLDKENRLNALENFGKEFAEQFEFEFEFDGEFENLVIDNGIMSIQKRKIRRDQVKNNAGGYVFPVSDLTRIRRFLILGTSGGTYYSTEKELTFENLNALVEIINKGKAGDILREILEISISGRNAKQDQVMLALALCARYRVHDCQLFLKSDSQDVKNYSIYLLAMHKAAFSIVNDVCRIPTHLYSFVKHCEFVAKEINTSFKGKSTGWGRLMRAAIAHWYTCKTPDKLALHLTKYRQRDGWSHRDLFRLAHPVAKKHRNATENLLEIEQLYQYAVKGTVNIRKRKLSPEDFEIEAPAAKYSAVQMDNEMKSSALDLIEVFEFLNNYTSEDDVVQAIRTYHLVREHIPTEHLNSVMIWRALLGEMPMTAMVRNLGKMTSINALDRYYTDLVVSKLTNEDEIKKSKIHPIQLLLAKTVYESGHGDKGKLKWEMDSKIDAALETAFYKSFANVTPTGRRFCLAFDVSGSMMDKISGTVLSCREASAAIGLVCLRNEEHDKVKCIGFSHNLMELPYTKDWTLKKVLKHMGNLPFGATDCALPMLWAAKKKLLFDVFVVFTDNETFFGKVHPFKALEKYRKVSGIHDAKLVVMGMTATNFSIADPTDSGMLDVVGFDPAVPLILNDFVLGKI